jgi:hypothetical protein
VYQVDTCYEIEDRRTLLRLWLVSAVLGCDADPQGAVVMAIVKGRKCRVTHNGVDITPVTAIPVKHINPRCADCGCFVSPWNQDYCTNCDISRVRRRIRSDQPSTDSDLSGFGQREESNGEHETNR